MERKHRWINLKFIFIHYTKRLPLITTQMVQGFDLLKARKIYIFVTFVVTFLGSLKLALAGQAHTVYENYIFAYEAQDSVLVRKLVLKVKPALNELNEFFTQQTGGLITIYLTPSDSRYRKLTQNRIPEWSQAVAFTSQRFIVLRVASAEEVKTAPQTLLHELVHMHVAQKIPPGRMPLWLNEGLAQYLSNTELTLDDKVLLANKLALKQLLQLSALDSMQNFSAVKARLAYVQALSAVHFFVKTYDRPTLRFLIDNLALYHSANDAFRKTIGFDFIDFERQWYEDLKKNYRWLVILNIDNLIWVTMGMLAILAILAVRRRNQKKLAVWSEIESNDSSESEESNI